MSKLLDNITSDYFRAANSMRPKKARRRIVAYVESYDDVFFWRSILGGYEDETRYFEIMLPSRGTLERGKSSALMNLLDMVGQDMIACVDADYDYLLQGRTAASRKMLESPYVIHTYAYSIENWQCYAPSLHSVCVMASLNDRMAFDFVGFLEEYSEAVYPLLVWSILSYRRGTAEKFTITDFNSAIELGGLRVNDPKPSLASLRNKVRKKEAWLRERNPGREEAWEEVRRDLERLGVTPGNAYLYIQGHHLFDKVVSPIMTKVCNKLVKEREDEIRAKAVHSTQMHNELSCYSHSIQDVQQMLKKNTGFLLSRPFRRVHQEVVRFLELHSGDGGQA